VTPRRSIAHFLGGLVAYTVLVTILVAVVLVCWWSLVQLAAVTLW
jgi:hypothetical protein